MFPGPRRIYASFSLLILLAALSLCACAATDVTIKPPRHDFGNETVGLKTGLLTVTVTNSGRTGVTITSYQLDNPVFQLTQGIAPVKIGAGGTTHYTLLFAPANAQAYSGNFSVFLDNGQTLVLALTGTGTTTSAQATLSTSVVNFGSVPQGESVTQTVTLGNTGTQAFTLQTATTQPPFSIPFLSSLTIPPGGSLPIPVTYAASRREPLRNLLFSPMTPCPPKLST